MTKTIKVEFTLDKNIGADVYDRLFVAGRDGRMLKALLFQQMEFMLAEEGLRSDYYTSPPLSEDQNDLFDVGYRLSEEQTPILFKLWNQIVKGAKSIVFSNIAIRASDLACNEPNRMQQYANQYITLITPTDKTEQNNQEEIEPSNEKVLFEDDLLFNNGNDLGEEFDVT